MIVAVAFLGVISGAVATSSSPSTVIDYPPCEPEKPAVVSAAEHKTFAVIQTPKWRRHPTQEQIAAVFAGSSEDAQWGYSTGIKCFLDYGGQLRGCYVKDNYPNGSHLGEAILKISFLYQAWLADPRGVSGQIIEFDERFDPKNLPTVASKAPFGWDRVPSPEEITAVFPERANRLEHPGKASAMCVVEADGRLDGCQVTSESQVGFGYGEALLKLAPFYRISPSLASKDRKVEIRQAFTWELMPIRDQKLCNETVTVPLKQ